jgi:NarL family two-component system response regulator LiaR
VSRIAVVVVDDHDLLREGVSACLSALDDIEVVGEAPNAGAAITAVGELAPDVVVIDLVMPGMDGTAAIRELRLRHPQLGIIALSSFSESRRVREAVDAGANGYMVKSVDAESLARAVRSAAAGQSSFSPEAMQALTDTSAEDRTAALTAREAQTAALIAEGRTNAEIAAALDLSVFTVKNHVSSILMKLRVQTRTEAAAVIHRSRPAHHER